MRVDLQRGVGIALVLIVGFLAGCTSLSGVGGDSHYACPAPRGVQCGSVTANYLQSVHGDSPSLAMAPSTDSDRTRDDAASRSVLSGADFDADSSTTLRSTPRILRLWVAAWEDRDGVLHDAAFVFVPIDQGQWLVDHVRATARFKPRVIRPPSGVAMPTAPGDGTEPSASALPARTSPPKDSDAR